MPSYSQKAKRWEDRQLNRYLDDLDKELAKDEEEEGMYLYFFSDGEITKIDTIQEDDLQAIDNGDLQIVDISDPKNPREYYEGEWMEIGG